MISGVTSDCLKFVGKVPVDKERLTMAVMMGEMISETCFRREVGTGSRSHCLFGEAVRSFDISSTVAGRKEEKDVGVLGDRNEVVFGTDLMRF